MAHGGPRRRAAALVCRYVCAATDMREPLVMARACDSLGSMVMSSQPHIAAINPGTVASSCLQQMVSSKSSAPMSSPASSSSWWWSSTPPTSSFSLWRSSVSREAMLALRRRGIATGAGTGTGPGAGAGQRAKAVAFRIGADEALARFRAEVWEHWMGPLASRQQMMQQSLRSVSAVFLPFWTFNATVDVMYRGKVGTTRATTVWNPISRRWEQVRHTEWAATPWHRMHDEGVATEKDMQLYASTSLPRWLVDPLRGEAVRYGRTLTDDMLTGGRQLQLFSVSREKAWAAVKRHLRTQQQKNATDLLRQLYGADSVTDVEVQLRVVRVVGEPVFLPSYIVTHMYEGLDLTNVVSAVDGTVTGQRLYSPLKIAAATALALGSGGLFATHSAIWFFSVGLVSAAIGYAARWLPRVRAGLVQITHAKEVAELSLGLGNEQESGDDFHEADRARARGTTGAREGRFGYREEGGQQQEQQQWDWGQGWPGWGAQSQRVFWRFTRTGTFGGAGMEELLREMERMMRDAQMRTQYGGGRTQGNERAWQQQWERQQQQGEWQRQQRQQQQRWQGQESNRARAGPYSADDPKGYYAALGLSAKGRAATEQEIKTAFRQQAMRTHPDKEADETKRKEAEERFKRLGEAYEVLRNPTKRAAYDSGRL